MPNHNHIFRQAVLDFPKQFEFEPEVINTENLSRHKSSIIAGMGGSHLAADILQMGVLPMRLTTHSDYGLPTHIPDEELKGSLVIASSYSGNTEEAINAFETARSRGLLLAVIASRGELLERAQDAGVPFVDLPNTGIQPRMGIGFQLRAIAKILQLENILEETQNLSQTLHPDPLEEQGKMLAERLAGKIPVVYASRINYAIAYYWKITLNETAKIPAFYNVLPELNHNEMIGFDRHTANEELLKNITFIFLKDSADHPRVQKRMEILKQLYNTRGLPVEEVDMNASGGNIWHKAFSSVLLASWTAYHFAEASGVEANDVPMVEAFKKALAS